MKQNNSNITLNGDYDLFFSDDIDDDLKLIQLPSIDFVGKFEIKDEKGNSCVVIKAPTNSTDAVLCDNENTYSIKMAETSNTNMLIPLKEGAENKLIVKSRLFSVLELQKIKPNFNQLYNLLTQSYYEGDEYETENDKKYSFEDLKTEIQSSDFELLNQLNSMGALEIKGKWRLIKPSYYDEIFKQILDTSLAYEISLSSIKVSAIIEKMNLYEDFLIQHCLKMNGEKKGERESECYKLDPFKISVFRAKQVLEKEQKIPFDQFLEKWKDLIPTDYCKDQFDPSILKGMAFSEENNKGINMLVYFPEASLSKIARLDFFFSSPYFIR